jgi:hypothetical protein
MDKRGEIAEINPEALLMPEKFDRALIGFVERIGQEGIALYNTHTIIDIFIEDGMTEEEAMEWFAFNTLGSYCGEGTPAFATLFIEEVEKDDENQDLP